MNPPRTQGRLAIRRRRLVQLAALPLAGLALGACSSRFENWERGPFAVLLDDSLSPPHVATRRLAAFSAAESTRALTMSVQRLGPDADPRVLLRTLATGPVRMVIAAGPRAGAAMTALAPTLPRQRFTWLAGAASGADPAASLPANLSRYRLRVAEPAWLAGLLAAGVSRTRVIAIETLALGTADSPAPAPAIATAPGRSPDPVTAAFGEAARKADPAVRLIEMVTSGHPAADRDRPGETLPVQLAQARHAGADVLLTRADARDATVRQALAASGLRVIVLDPDGSSPLEPAPWLAGRLVIDEAPLIEAIFQDAADSVWRGGLERSVGLRQSALLRVEPATGTGSELLATIEQASLDLMARRIDPLGPGGATTRRGRP